MTELSDMGIVIALDDFGTGFASLSHLKQFPVDVLKVDTSFVHDIGRSTEAEAIVKAIIDLGHSLNMQIVAEGIETLEQEHQLAAMGCDLGQGYRFAKAVANSEVPRIIEAQEQRVRCAI